MRDKRCSNDALSKDEFERFILTRSLAPASRGTYRVAFLRFARWYGGESEPSEVDFARFRDELLAGGSASSTVDSTLTILSRYWDWRISVNLSTRNPAHGIRASGPPVRRRTPIDVDVLRRLFWAGRDSTERALVGLLGVNGLRVSEVIRADIQHLREIQGRTFLWLPGRDRDGQSGYELTPLVREVEDAMREQFGDRNSGPMFLNEDGVRINRGRVSRITVALAKSIGLGFKVTPNDLSYTLRSIAIREGFSYASVVRATGEYHPRRLERIVNQTSQPNDPHGADRLGHLVFAQDDTVHAHLFHVRWLLAETRVPPAVAAAYAGAALERHLRALSTRRGVQVRDEERAKLTTYAERLRGARILRSQDVQLIAVIARHRSAGAHGRFDEVSLSEAQWVLDAVENVASRFPE